ncbi:hypothetical protein ACFQL7_25810 [Halocatena marina]|uniref:Uncharacterized protein n=1 Tax=Halocatena marina TaxID=2934937 RepID=A0ABD5YUH0_9EURY
MSKGGNEKTHATQRRLLATLGSMGVAGKPGVEAGTTHRQHVPEAHQLREATTVSVVLLPSRPAEGPKQWK